MGVVSLSRPLLSAILGFFVVIVFPTIAGNVDLFITRYVYQVCMIFTVFCCRRIPRYEFHSRFSRHQRGGGTHNNKRAFETISRQTAVKTISRKISRSFHRRVARRWQSLFPRCREEKSASKFVLEDVLSPTILRGRSDL